eukprot:SAG31_NODE_83_length_27039_cov_14.035746_25_plen_54_part_00
MERDRVAVCQQFTTSHAALEIFELQNIWLTFKLHNPGAVCACVYSFLYRYKHV